MQGFCAGVGNWVADEVLWQARLHPEQVVSALGDEHIKALHQALREVVQTAVAADADSTKFPKDWMFHVRCDGHPVYGGFWGSVFAVVPSLLCMNRRAPLDTVQLLCSLKVHVLHHMWGFFVCRCCAWQMPVGWESWQSITPSPSTEGLQMWQRERCSNDACVTSCCC